MQNIDSRLLECNGEPEFTVNFNRVLALFDGAVDRIISLEGDVTALKALAVCTVTFDSDGGSAVTAQEIAFDGTAEEPTAPTKDGFTLDGWYTGEVVYDFDTPVRANITLTAHWTVAG